MDWKSLIADLKLRGANQVQVAALCGCTQSTISDISTGKSTRPSFAIGQALLNLHGASKRELQRRLSSIEAKAP